MRIRIRHCRNEQHEKRRRGEFVNTPTKYSTVQRSCGIDGQTIRGLLYKPDTGGRVPLVIGSHGFGSAYETLIPYAEAFASHGLASYIFDFRGGGDHGTSDGTTTQMSVMTEVADLEAVLKEARTWEGIDPDRIVLLGASQGGFVSAVTAARMRDDVCALILLFPAFVLVDDMHRNFGSLANVPDEVFYRDQLLLGKQYFYDVWYYDPYKEIGEFEGPVLILHGTADAIVPMEYSERAKSVYKNAKLIEIQAGDHGFRGKALELSIQDILAFLEEHRI